VLQGLLSLLQLPVAVDSSLQAVQTSQDSQSALDAFQPKQQRDACAAVHECEHMAVIDVQ
jgi:hypothetical protein